MRRPYVSEGLDHRLGDLLERNRTVERSGQRRFGACDVWRGAYGCNDLLRAVEQNGPMLQECVSFPDLRRAHQLATGDEYLAAYRGREARRVLVDSRGWWRLVGGQRGVGTEGPERCSDAFVDGVVRVTYRADRRYGRGYRVGHLVLVPHGATTCRSPHHVEPTPRDLRVIVAGRRLVAAQRQTRRVEAVEPQEAQARAVGAVEQRRVDRHVFGAGAARSVEGELAGACRLNQRRAHTPPSAGTRTPGSDRRTRRPRGSPTATPCATASTPRGRRRARAHTADPRCRR